MITAEKIAVRKNFICVLASSSIANTTPPNGVLNAAARPAAAPVRIKRCLHNLGHDAGIHLLTVANTDAAIWIVGPSLPIAPPPATINKLETIFVIATRMLSSFLILLSSFGLDNSIAAITWG